MCYTVELRNLNAKKIISHLLRRVRFAISHFIVWWYQFYLRFATHSDLKIRQMLFSCTILCLLFGCSRPSVLPFTVFTIWAEVLTIRTNRGRICSSGKSKNHSTMEIFSFVNRPVAAKTAATCQTIHKLYWTQDRAATKVWQQWLWLRDYVATDIKNSFYIYVTIKRTNFMPYLFHF